MEQLFIYLIKSCVLIAMFYLAYHFLVRKETFFNCNRWFLLGGMSTSLLLPLFVIKKIILVEKTERTAQEFVAYSKQSSIIFQDVPVVETFDWMHYIWISYVVIACLLLIRILFNFTSLYRMLYKQQIIKVERFMLVNLNENIAPFSFFNYIVYNANLYTDDELQSILLHEKIHSQEKHSLDILIAKLFCILLWFNPFVWLYKKAIIQNLEYIADQKATEQMEDKKSYQRALLKVVSHESCLSITNNFHQSLIKKRIVMLNKNQSQKRNLWKYAVIIPALICFVFLFQIKIVAQKGKTGFLNKKEQTDSRQSWVQNKPNEIPISGAYVFDKISSDEELKNDVANIIDTYNIKFTISNVKRNSKGEIIAIKMSFDDKKGNKGNTEQIRNIPIRPIFFQILKYNDKITKIGFYDNSDLVNKTIDTINENKIIVVESIKDDAIIYVDGERYGKEFLNDLDPKGFDKIEILKDFKSLEKYGAKEKNEVYIITTNWTTRDEKLIKELESPRIFTLKNGDEVVVFDRFNMKLVGYPVVQFTDSSPILICDDIQQNNPRLFLENMNLSKIKDLNVFDKNNKEVTGTIIYKIIIKKK